MRSGHPRDDISVTGPIFLFILFPASCHFRRVSSRKGRFQKCSIFVVSLHFSREIVVQGGGSKSISKLLLLGVKAKRIGAYRGNAK